MILEKEKIFARNIIRLLIKPQGVVGPNEQHICEAMNWLYRSQTISGTNTGVSEGYHTYHGWLPPYPEVTGYIIETFFKYAAKTSECRYRDVAIRMADWLVSIQHDDGSIPDNHFRKKMVFDTGQTLFGFVNAFKETGDKKFKHAAIKAADWIIDSQEKDGSWVRFAFNHIPHTYYSRVAWGLLKVHELTACDRYEVACRKKIEWCLRQQVKNGWFRNASFSRNHHHRPFTHTIAYTIRGILESGIYLQETRYVTAAKLALDNIDLQIPESGFVPGTFGEEWNGNTRYSCLTGNVQLSICNFILARMMGSETYYRRGERINRYVKSKQNHISSNENIRGAIAGSSPIWGEYIHFAYPNWAVKFFVDALMLEDEVAQRHNWT